MKLSRLPSLSLLAASVMVVSSQAAFSADIRDLGTFGANATAQSLGVFIDDWLVDNSDFAEAGGLEQELYDLCTEYANQTAAASNRAEYNELFTLLEFISHEEVGAIGSGFSDTAHDQISSVLGRLQSLRSGKAAVASVNGFQSGGAAGSDFSKLSYYTNFTYGDGEKDRTTNEQGFDFDSEALTFGADYRFDDNLVAGVAVGLGKSDVDIDGNSGETEGDTTSLTFYGTYYQDNWYFDASLGLSSHDYDSVRNLPISQLSLNIPDQRLESSTDGDSLNWSIGGGYTQAIDTWTANYTLRLDEVNADIDGYSESGGSLALRVGDQDVDSRQAVLGAQFSTAVSTDWGVMSPYVGVEFHHEFDDETRIVTASYLFDLGNNQFSFTSDDADSSYYLLSLGSSFVLGQGTQLFVNLDHVGGLDDVDSNALTAGIRFEL